MESARTDAQLQREVLPPYRGEHGLGVLIVVSTAMFCTVLSSAFILQARSARQCPSMNRGAAVTDSVPTINLAPPIYDVDELHYGAKFDASELVEIIEASTVVTLPTDGVTLEVVQRTGADELTSDPKNCGKAMYSTNGDGSVSVTFSTCPTGTKTPWNLRSADVPDSE